MNQKDFFRIELEEKEEWQETISCFEKAHIFHSWCWAKTFAEAYGHKPVLICVGKQGDIRAAIPVSIVSRPIGKPLFVSMPYTDFVSPLMKGPFSVELISAVFGILDIVNLQIRTDFPFNSSIAESGYSTYRLELLDNENDMLNSFSSKTIRYPIRKASRQNFSVRTAKIEDIPEFYKLINLTRKRHGLPTPPLKFYISLFNNVNMNGCGSLYLAERPAGSIIAASWFLWFNKMGIYKYNVTDPRSDYGKANYLLLWHGIKESIRRRCQVFDLGRVSDNNKGLIEFKRRWHGQKIPLQYMNIFSDGSMKPISGDESGFFRFTKRIFTFMPAGFSRVAGNILYRYFT